MCIYICGLVIFRNIYSLFLSVQRSLSCFQSKSSSSSSEILPDISKQPGRTEKQSENSAEKLFKKHNRKNKMSCNGCRVLRKGCSENCILRPCIQWIETADAQGHATVFVAKFFGRAGLMSFISAVPESQRPALFQSLLYEACGRTVNPVNGAIGMLWTGNWNICQAAVETVLRGGSLRPIPELLAHGGGFAGFPSATSEEASEICTEMLSLQQNDDSSDRNIYHHSRFSSSRSRSTLDSPPAKRKRVASSEQQPSSELDLSLIPNFPINKTMPSSTRRRSVTPSMNSEGSVTTTTTTTSVWDNTATGGGDTNKLLNLFV